MNRLHGEMDRKSLQNALKLAHRGNFRKAYLHPAVEVGLIETTLPDKLNSRLQRYRLTELGKHTLARLRREGVD